MDQKIEGNVSIKSHVTHLGNHTPQPGGCCTRRCSSKVTWLTWANHRPPPGGCGTRICSSKVTWLTWVNRRRPPGRCGTRICSSKVTWLTWANRRRPPGRCGTRRCMPVAPGCRIWRRSGWSSSCCLRAGQATRGYELGALKHKRSHWIKTLH